MTKSSFSVLSYDAGVFDHGETLRVHAIFPHAWQLRSENGRILSVVASRWNGPLAMRMARLPGSRPVFLGMAATLREDHLEVGSTVISLEGAKAWGPRKGAYRALDLSLLGADTQLIRRKARAGNRGGLVVGDRGRPHPRPFSREAGEGRHDAGTYVPGAFNGSPTRGDATNSWAVRGDAAIAGLEEALVWEEADAIEQHAVGLQGLGPGLTPSGDDVLCGLMAGLLMFGRRSPRHRERCVWAGALLARGIVGPAARRTTSFSATLLEAASRGVVVEPLLQVLETLAGSGPVAGVDEVVMLGHTSGSDMLTGVLMACTVLLRWEEMFAPAMVGSR